MNCNEPNHDWVPAEDCHFVFHAEALKTLLPNAAVFDDPLGRLVDPPESDTRQPLFRWKFRKVYHAPGYPIDPRNAKARALDSYVNAFAPQSAGTFDRTVFQRWLNDNIN